jgi:U3 small nucleolar RNA-associated protein 20
MKKGHELPEWLSKDARQDVNDEVWEEERTWRDGAAHNIRSVISRWLDGDHVQKAIILVSRQSSRGLIGSILVLQ